MQDRAYARLGNVQLALATLASAFAAALERYHPGVAAHVLSNLQEGIEHVEDIERDDASGDALAAATCLVPAFGGAD